jgi:hypothetical protein
MDPRYEFVTSQQNQLITLSYLTRNLRSCSRPNRAVWVQVVGRCGDLLIVCGSWLKRVSHSPIESNSIGLSPQK